MGHGNPRPEIELVQAFISVLVTSNFDDDSIKNEWASLETPFSHCKCMGNFLAPQGQLTPLSAVRSGRNSNSSEILCMSSLPASIKRIGSKTTKKRWRHRFPHYKSMGAFCCHWSNLPQNLMQSFSQWCYTKFYQHWPTGFRDIEVWQCGRRRKTTGILNVIMDIQKIDFCISINREKIVKQHPIPGKRQGKKSVMQQQICFLV